MILNQIFSKQVDRPIEGVIKADDAESLMVEIEEYVLTNEVEKRMESFLDAYTNYENANGVWVSGFYGSGKSHLLKMLALMLENREISGHSVVTLMAAKCADNQMLRAGLLKAASIPSKSILFNIDQKADVIGKDQVDALLAVFIKVFDETCGFYGKQPWLAQFERDLEQDNLLTSFISKFEAVAEKSWEWGRSRPTRIAEQADAAFNAVTGQNQKDVLDKYRTDYRLSIEDFAEQVKAYIDTKGPDFRLNFFVDEVGQYIADNTKLMTNLQTIAESLATKCRGRAWIIVTAQEDMGSVLGEMKQQQGNDFSKIQARFANRMKLTSADVAEVIQKRLLLKTAEGNTLMEQLYRDNANNFRTLFDFADGSQTYRNYRDDEHFAQTYPFVPYQFFLFQSSIQNLSAQNAFEGKHSSVGERSMLGVFQQVAIAIGTKEVGQLATFDLMFEGIRTALKTNIQRAVINAEANLRSPFAVRLLKALFLLKYVKEFKPSVRNLCVLMTERFDQDIPALRNQVEEALALLELETYIERNGELYYFLTDDEKDVEQAIKNTDVDILEVTGELEKLVFNNAIKTVKIRYEGNKEDYPFTKKLDGKVYGRESELAINVITPFHELAGDEATLSVQNMGTDELLVIMPPDARLVNDLLMYKRTEKYIRQNMTSNQVDGIKRILEEKGAQNRDRHVAIQQRVETLLGAAKMYVNGAPLDVSSENAQARVTRGFQDLVTRTYTNLRMISSTTFEESQVGMYLRQTQNGLFGDDAAVVSEAEQEVLAFIHQNQRGGIRTTLKGINERFERKPYGWYYAAILCNVAKLCARAKVEVRLDSNLLEDNALEANLKNTARAANIVLLPQIEFNASQVRTLKAFYEEMFDAPSSANDAKALGNETAAAFSLLHQQLTNLLADKKTYPFLEALVPAIAAVNEAIGKPYTWYLTDLPKHEDSLLDLKEQTLDPIRVFMNGPQKDIFTEASALLATNEENLVHLASDTEAQIKNILTSPTCFIGNKMQQLRTLVDDLQDQLLALVSSERTKAKEQINELMKRVVAIPQYQGLTSEQQTEVDGAFNVCLANLDRQKLVAVIQMTATNFENTEYPKILSKVSTLAQPAPAPQPSPGHGAPDQDAPPKPPVVQPQPVIQYVSAKLVKVPFAKPWLASDQDVDVYIEAMREALKAELRNGKQIQI